MSVDDPQNFRGQLRSQRKKLRQLECQEDIESLRQYIKRVKNVEKSTIINHVSCLRILSDYADKPLLDHTGVEMDELIIDVANERGWTDGTQRNYEKSARRLLRFYNLDDEADEIAFTDVSPKKIRKEDTLSGDEIKELLNNCARMDRDRAMIYLLYETGARLSAILSLRVKNVQFGEGPGKSTLIRFNETATGLKGAENHEIIVKPSETFLKRYIITEHPDPENPEAPFFCVTARHYDSNKDNSLSPSFFRRRLRRLVRDSDIPESKVNPHNFRHSRVTQMRLEGYSERQIIDHMNWGPNSEQLETYDHTSDKDRHDAMAEMMGLEVEETEIRQPKLDDCPGCGRKIDDWMTWSQCPECHAQLKLYKKPGWLDMYLDLMDADENFHGYIYFLENPHLLYDDYMKLPEKTRQSIEYQVYTHNGDRAREVDFPVTVKSEMVRKIPHGEEQIRGRPEDFGEWIEHLDKEGPPEDNQ